MDAKKILIVEDEKLIALEIAARLERLGYNVIGNAVNAEEAIDFVEKFMPDIIFMDIRIEGETDGIETAKRVQAIAGIPIIYLTAYADQETLNRAKETNPHGYLTKPIQEKELRITLEMALHKIQIEKELDETKLKLIQSEKQYRLIAENASDLIFIYDFLPEPHYSYISPSCKQLTGYDQEEGYSNPSIYHKLVDDAEKFKEYLMAETPDSVPFEEKWRKKDGTFIWIEQIISRMFNEKGDVISFQSSVRNITERKEAEIKLKSSEERFKIIFDYAPDAYYLHDLQGYFIDGNIAAEKMLGYQKEELIGKSFLKLNILSDNQVKIAARVLGKLIAGQSNGPYEYVLNRKDGSKIAAEISNHPVNIQGQSLVLGIARDITDRRQIQDQLQQTKQTYLDVFNTITEAIYILDETGTFIEINKGAEKMYGFTHDELIGKTPLSVAAPGMNNVEEILEIMATVLLTGKPVNFDFWGVRKNGEIFPKEVIVNKGTYFGKEVLIATARDNTVKKKTEKELKSASDNWNRTFRSMNSGIALLDANQKIIQTNQAFQDIANEKEIDLIGKQCYHVVHNNGCAINGCPFERMKESKNREYSETIVNGKICEILADPIFDANGFISGAVYIITDISQRKRDEQIQHIIYGIAHASMVEKKLENLLVIVRQELSKVLDTSNFFVALYNPEKDTLKKIIYEDEKDDYSEWDAKNSFSGMVVKMGETLLLDKEKSERLAKHSNIEIQGSPAVCWLGVPIINEEKAIGVMVVQSYHNENAYNNATARLMEMIAHELAIVIQKTNMIQELVAAKEKAVESDRLKSAFLMNMSHEIRTPMNGILGFLELLNEPELEEETRKSYNALVTKSSQRLLETINDILEISKIEAGVQEVSFQEINTAEVMQFHHDFFSKQASEKGLTLKIREQITGSDAQMRTDKYKLDGILTNLIKNAIKFTFKGGIEIGNYLEGNNLVFYVKDSGNGIPPERIEAVFDRFVQADIKLTRAHEGSGLGLSIVKAYVEAVNGNIKVRSRVGKGSTFYVSIPYMSVTVKPETSGINNYVPDAPLSNLTILVAEDDETSYLLLKSMLIREGITLIHTVNGKDTIMVLQKNPDISLVLMDIKMPVMNGLEAASLIRKFNKTIPIIAQTAYAYTGDSLKAKEAGCNDFISKPINRVELIRLIHQYTKDSVYKMQGATNGIL